MMFKQEYATIQHTGKSPVTTQIDPALHQIKKEEAHDYMNAGVSATLEAKAGFT